MPDIQTLPKQYSMWPALKAVTDPNTGFVYIPNGNDDGASMAVYNPNGSFSSSVAMPGSDIMPATISYYTAVWSTRWNSMLLYGGVAVQDTSYGNPYLIEFVPQTKKWARIDTTGTSPGNINRHCMAPAYNGTKMIVFGGMSLNRTPQGSVYVLDLETRIWTKGTNIAPAQNRSDMACAAAGDNFVAWGGEYNATKISNFGTPVIYNIRDNQWTTTFAVGLTTPTPDSSPALPAPLVPLSTPNNSSNSAAAIGGGIGAAMFVALFTFFMYRRYRLQQISKGPSETDTKTRELLESPDSSSKVPSFSATTMVRQLGSMSSAKEQEQMSSESASGSPQIQHLDIGSANLDRAHMQTPSPAYVYLPSAPPVHLYTIPDGGPTDPSSYSTVQADSSTSQSSPNGDSPSYSFSAPFGSRNGPQAYEDPTPARAPQDYSHYRIPDQTDLQKEHPTSSLIHTPPFYPELSPATSPLSSPSASQDEKHQYFPPPPLPSSAAQSPSRLIHLHDVEDVVDADVVDDHTLQQRLSALRVQHELRLEQIRLEQEAEVKIAMMKAQHEQKLQRIRLEKEAELRKLHETSNET
ncbi:hypothetical protein BGX28_006846 [Mortierella sp. GBA30]|nr:hypothetical protein BGX28_006846 [Mortierella sp. GBA30]